MMEISKVMVSVGLILTASSSSAYAQNLTVDNNAYVMSKLGVRTSTPASYLQVINAEWATDASSGVLLTGLSGSTYGPAIHLDAGPATSGHRYDLRSTGSLAGPGPGAFTIYDYTSSAYRFLIDPSGNVGIGTTSPQDVFHVSRSSYAPIVLSDTSQATNAKTWRIANASAQLQFSAINDAYSSGTDVMVLTRSGNVGVGTTSPAAMLHVSSPAGTIGVQIPNSNGTDTTYFNYTDGKNWIRGTTILADNGGNVGIGTTSPGYKLDVAGDINTTGDIRKNGTAYTNPAWVFQHYYTGQADSTGPHAMPPAYKGLRTIDEAETLTRREHELPSMLLSLGGGLFERGDLLLAGVEEAFLYIFQLHHRMEAIERNQRSIMARMDAMEVRQGACSSL